MGFVVVFVLRTRAAYVSEGSVGGEDYDWIVDGTEILWLGIFQIVVGLQVKGIVSNVGLPLVGDLIEGFLGGVGLRMIVLSSWFVE